MKEIGLTDKSDAVEFGTVKDLVFGKILPVLTFSAISGVVIGLAVTLFNVLLNYIGKKSSQLIALIYSELKFLPLYMLMAAVLAVAAYYLIKILPEAKGSGIPRTEAAILGKKNLTWWKMAAATFLGSILSFSSGLSVGAEGPSVQMGAGLAGGFEKCNGKTNGRHMYRRYLAGAGAAAGVATAFGAPLTGLFFVQEEILRRFNPLMIAACSASVICAGAVNSLVMGALGFESYFFAKIARTVFPPAFLWAPVAAGVFCALLARLFTAAVFALDRVNKNSKINGMALLLGIFLLTSVVNVFLPSSAGSGHGLINSLLAGGLEVKLMPVDFFVKTALILLCFRSGATGGMMVPMLTIGALLGGMTGQLCSLIGMPAAYVPVMAAVSMCVYFGSAICAPFTAVLLFAETVGDTGMLAVVLLAALTAMAVGRLLKQKPLYDVLAEREADKRMLSFY